MVIIDAKTGAVLARHDPPDFSPLDLVKMAFGSAWTVTRSQPDLVKRDPATGAEVDRLEIGPSPSWVTASPDALWVTQLDGTLTRVDPKTMSITGRWTTNYSYLAVAEYAFGALWMTSIDDGAIARVDLTALG
jgi:streptogramin lyase